MTPPEDSRTDKPVVAAFDFDGTITLRDTFVPFLMRTFPLLRVAGAFAALSWEGLRVKLHLSDRDRFKALLVQRLFAGEEVTRLNEAGRAHARAVESWLRPAALERIAWHRARGHRLVLVSASLDFYLRPIIEQLGFDDLLCTRLVQRDGCCTGALDGGNCRAMGKVLRLESLLGERDGYEMYAYGDSSGDREMLADADHPFFRPFH